MTSILVRAAQSPPQQPVQQPAQVDLTPVQEAFAAALVALLARWAAVKAAWVVDLVRQVVKAARADDIAAFAALGVDHTHAAAIVTDAMTAHATEAGEHVVQEARAQGATTTAQMPDAGQIQAQAEVTAGLLATALALSAGSEARRVHHPGRAADDTGGDVQAHLDALTDAVPAQQLGYALHVAELGARLATLIYSADVQLYADESMDDATCAPCKGVDGKYLGVTGGEMDLVTALYPNGGFIGCLGGIRCRGTVIGIWPEGSD